MATYQEIRHQIASLSPSEQLQLLEELAAIVRHSIVSTAVPERPDTASTLSGKGVWAEKSALEAARSVIGEVGDGPPDLSTNPIYMEGF